jgi:hypothetical protein
MEIVTEVGGAFRTNLELLLPHMARRRLNPPGA